MDAGWVQTWDEATAARYVREFLRDLSRSFYPGCPELKCWEGKAVELVGDELLLRAEASWRFARTAGARAGVDEAGAWRGG